MTTHPQHSTGPSRPPILAILLVPLAVAVVLALFAWPSAKQEPRDLPVAVAGPPAAVEVMEKELAAREGAFDVQRYPDEAAARDAIEDRDIYGAFVATGSGQKVLTASGASSNVAQLLTRAATEGRTPAEAATVHVHDVVPAAEGSTALGSAISRWSSPALWPAWPPWRLRPAEWPEPDWSSPARHSPGLPRPP
jgi:hypothetical protein